MVHTTDDGPPIQLTSGSSLADPQMIQRLPVNQSQCTLGIHLSPDDHDTHEFQYRLQQATQMKQKIGHLQRKYVDKCFLTQTWEFLDSINCTVHHEPDRWLHPQCKGDRFIMEELSHVPGIKPINLVHAQRCRLYLGVTTLADICSSDGKTICAWAQTGTTLPRHSLFNYPNQAKPSPPVWNTWRKLLHQRFCT